MPDDLIGALRRHANALDQASTPVDPARLHHTTAMTPDAPVEAAEDGHVRTLSGPDRSVPVRWAVWPPRNLRSVIVVGAAAALVLAVIATAGVFDDDGDGVERIVTADIEQPDGGTDPSDGDAAPRVGVFGDWMPPGSIVGSASADEREITLTFDLSDLRPAVACPPRSLDLHVEETDDAVVVAVLMSGDLRSTATGACPQALRARLARPLGGRILDVLGYGPVEVDR
jgi:hypothetical protein